MTDVRDILLTQGSGTQLFLLFNHGGTGTTSRGEVLAYARLSSYGSPPPLGGISFPTLFNPAALCAGGDGAGTSGNRIFVLDQGDTAMARANPLTGICGDTTGLSTVLRGKWRMGQITNLGLYWHVREFGLLGGDTISTFADTTLGFANGVAADAHGRVYVSGIAIVVVVDQQSGGRLVRTFEPRIYRYVRAATVGSDPTMPGCSWRRDATWSVAEGTGVGTVQDPRSLAWGAAGSNGLYVCDFARNWVQKLNDQVANTGYFAIDGTTAPGGVTISGPTDVAVDLKGFIYFADSGHQRVLRYNASGAYVQVVNTDTAVQLLAPGAVAADDSLVFVGDPSLAEVIRYKRRC